MREKSGGNPFDQLNIRRLHGMLTTATFGRRLIYRPQIGSTNDLAKDLASEGAPEGTVVVADEQTAGRGRLGRRWLAPPGSALLCSILFRPTLPLRNAPQLTMVCALAAADAVATVARLDVALKWPNDLIVATGGRGEAAAWRKLAGLLTETGVMGDRLDFVVVGIGLNANVPAEVLPQIAPRATSLRAETGREADREALLASLLAGIERRYAALQAGQSPHTEWAARLATLGRSVRATTPQGPVEGVAEAVDAAGALLVRAADGTLHRLVAGDVTLASGAPGAIPPSP
jgi:BirA family biotin operon repressor/biotin-[acetyl-CoA-carboxylase] ligase